MYLPTDPNMVWPPAPYDVVQTKIAEYAAWYSGDPNELINYYSTRSLPTVRSYGQYRELPNNRPSQYRGGLVGAVARMFWGTPLPAGTTNPIKMHIPLAEEIAEEGAHQLFKNPPRVELKESAYQERYEQYVDHGLFAWLLNAAEVASALTGVYLRLGYDESLSRFPLKSLIHPDAAVPEFSYGYLREVIFWRTLEDGSGTVLRHLERHAPGIIEHALYRGGLNTIGRTVPLNSHPVTRGLLPQNPIELPVLDVVYIPNRTTRLWRDGGQASNLGRSDFGSVTTILDGLDETWTSWMRDIRLGKSRIFIPQGYLESEGRGKPAAFDLDRELFVEVDAMGGSDDKLTIQPEQFAIRNESHLATAMALTERAISGAGYSAQTFGLSPDVAMTATESDDRTRRTINTRAAKIPAWIQGMREYLTISFYIDAILGNVPKPTDELDVSIEFPPAIERSPKDVADTVLTLRNARAASDEILVRMQHPTWDEPRIQQEITAIQQTYTMVP